MPRTQGGDRRPKRKGISRECGVHEQNPHDERRKNEKHKDKTEEGGCQWSRGIGGIKEGNKGGGIQVQGRDSSSGERM